MYYTVLLLLFLNFLPTLCLEKCRGNCFHLCIAPQVQNLRSLLFRHSWDHVDDDRENHDDQDDHSDDHLTRMFLDLMSRWAIAGLPRLPEISVWRWLTPQAIEWVNLRQLDDYHVDDDDHHDNNDHDYDDVDKPCHCLNIKDGDLKIIVKASSLIIVGHQQHLEEDKVMIWSW